MTGKPAAAQPPGFLSITDGDARWELPGEASLFALALPPTAGNAGQALVRISLHDSYGPIPGCAIALRDAGAGDDAWQAMALREELIEDPEAGGMRLRAPGEPAPLGEAPWSATFEHPWPLASGRSRVEIRVQSSIDALNLVIDDWTPGA